MADGDNVVLGTQNTSSFPTRIVRIPTTGNVFPSLEVSNDDGPGVIGNSTSQEGIGVVGHCTVGGGTGVHGEAVGEIGTGVHGEVVGEGPGTVGVLGEAARFGVVAAGNGDGGIGVWGDSLNRGIGVAGVELSGEGWAGFFYGRVHIRDHLTVGGAISVALRHSDGSLRRMYALQSPESWFEDMGRAEVVDGRAQVELDHEFAAMVQTHDYHVFLTPEGDTQGLFVSARSLDGFEVREQQGGTSNLTFSYRVVAKRRDIEAERLQRLEGLPADADVLRPESIS